MKTKTSTKHILSAGKCKLDGRKWNSNQEWNNDKRQFECKNPIDFLYAKKIMFGIPLLEFYYKWQVVIN